MDRTYRATHFLHRSTKSSCHTFLPPSQVRSTQHAYAPRMCTRPAGKAADPLSPSNWHLNVDFSLIDMGLRMYKIYRCLGVCMCAYIGMVGGGGVAECP